MLKCPKNYNVTFWEAEKCQNLDEIEIFKIVFLTLPEVAWGCLNSFEITKVPTLWQDMSYLWQIVANKLFFMILIFSLFWGKILGTAQVSLNKKPKIILTLDVDWELWSYLKIHCISEKKTPCMDFKTWNWPLYRKTVLTLILQN